MATKPGNTGLSLGQRRLLAVGDSADVGDLEPHRPTVVSFTFPFAESGLKSSQEDPKIAEWYLMAVSNEPHCICCKLWLPK